MYLIFISTLGSFFWGILFLAAASLYEKHRPFAQNPGANAGTIHYPQKPLIATASVSLFISCAQMILWVGYVLILFGIFGDNGILHLRATEHIPHFQIITISLFFNLGLIVFTFIIVFFLSCPRCNRNVAMHDRQPDEKRDKILGCPGGAAVLLSALFRQKFRCSYCGQAYAL